MESQPQNPELGINPENFHLWAYDLKSFYIKYARPLSVIINGLDL